MEFNDYLAENLGSHVNDLSQQQLLELEKLYGQLMIKQFHEREVTKKEDKRKAQEMVIYLSEKLAATLNEIKLGFGIENDEDINKINM